MSALADHLRRRIARTGPIRMAEFMAACLTHPTHGYYVTRDPLGRAGDFTTAPEISQMFGEMLGIWLAETWLADGAPGHITLAEPGPGRGTLMADLLRATRGVPGFHAALDIWLLEASPVLRARQRDALQPVVPRWADRVEDLPRDRPLYVIANEFFDALPIRQFERSGTQWAERMVGLDATGTLQQGLAPACPDADLDRRFGSCTQGECVEICPAAEAVMSQLAGIVAAQGGAILALDYGGWDGVGDTLQAVSDHGFVSILEHPGTVDLTAHVGFRWLAEASAPLRAAFDTQGAFLERLGITARAQQLASRAGDPESVVLQHRRLTHPEEMGSLFKVLALRPEPAATPPGFAP